MNLIREKAFRLIQNTPHMYRAWNEAKTESARTDMLIEIAYSYGVDDGRHQMEEEYCNALGLV